LTTTNKSSEDLNLRQKTNAQINKKTINTTELFARVKMANPFKSSHILTLQTNKYKKNLKLANFKTSIHLVKLITKQKETKNKQKIWRKQMPYLLLSLMTTPSLQMTLEKLLF